jgi:hypothetical protein
MPAPSEIYQQLWQLFYHPASLEEVLEGYRRIEELAGAGDLEQKEAAELKAHAFKAMQEASLAEPESASVPILDLLLPECLRGSRNDAFEVRVSKSRYRERLRDWLDSLDEPWRSNILSDVISRLIHGLSAPEPDLVCHTIGAVGYRNRSVIESLWKVADEYDDETGDIALSCLSALGLPAPENPRLVLAVQSRASKRCNADLIGAMHRLADPAFLDVIERYWLPKQDPEAWVAESFFVLGALVAVANKATDGSDLSERVWDLLMAYHRLVPGKIDGNLYVRGDLAPLCNSARVIPDLLDELLIPPDGSEGSEVRRLQLHSRLDGCVRPVQLEGWIRPLNATTLQALRLDARRDTRVYGSYKTLWIMLKESAWEALLSHGDKAMVSEAAFEEAVGGETSPFVRDKIADVLACFRLDPLPRTAVRWVSECIDIGRNGVSDELLFRLAATRLLRSAATREAFGTLLHFGFTIDGAVLRESAEAVVDVALVLVSRGDPTIVAELAAIAIRGTDRRNRVVAVETLSVLVACGFVSTEILVDLSETLNEDSRDSYERSRIVETLGFLPRELISPALEQELASWAGGTDELALRSLETLARLDRLLVHPELLTDRLGLRFVDDYWNFASTTNYAGNTGLILGLLHERHPGLFLQAVCSFVRDCDWMYTAGLLHFFGGLGGPQRQVPANLRDALIDRIKSRQSRSSVETELFGILGQWDAGLLASQAWSQYWSDWLPDARVALADALGDLGPELRELAVAHLLSLTKDGMYAVRRSAYRSLGRVSRDSLLALCQACAFIDVQYGEIQPSIELRRRGAEACSWLPDEEFTAVFQSFATDPERTIRDTAVRMMDERRVRINALGYLSRVLSSTSGDTEQILTTWRFGRALSYTGDDFCIRSIQKHIASGVTPSNVRHWLNQIWKGIESSWKKVTQSWPEPWLSWQGSIEENRGILIFPGNDQVLVQYTICVQPPLTPSDVGNWRGAAWAVDGTNTFLMMPRNAILVLANEKRGEINITVSSLDRIQFVGSGPLVSQKGP